MEHKASITALMSSFGRAFHAENEEHPVFADHLARALMTDEEYAAVQSDILGGEPMKTAFSYGALEKLLEKHGVSDLRAAPALSMISKGTSSTGPEQS